MEGIILNLEGLTSPGSVIGAVSFLAVVFGVALFGYMAEEEANRTRIFLAESPFTDVNVKEASVKDVKYFRAA